MVVSRPFGVSVPLVLSFSPIFLSVWDANELIFPTKVANTLTFSQRYGSGNCAVFSDATTRIEVSAQVSTPEISDGD